MKIKNTANAPRGYMDGRVAVILQAGETADAPEGVNLGDTGLVEVKDTPKPAPKAEIKDTPKPKKKLKIKDEG